jgi:hypothetical protein
VTPGEQVVHRHPGRGQGLGVGRPLVAQRVELGGHDQAGGRFDRSPRSGDAFGSLRSAGSA